MITNRHLDTVRHLDTIDTLDTVRAEITDVPGMETTTEILCGTLAVKCSCSFSDGKYYCDVCTDLREGGARETKELRCSI